MTKFHYYKLSKTKKIRYLKHYQKNRSYIVFLHGFMSDLEGKKPKTFLNFAKKNKLGFLALEYSGHGKSSGKFTTGNISNWTKETSLLIKRIVKRNKIVLVGIVSKKNSVLYKSSDVKLYIPESKESGHGIVPTSSTTSQLALGDALAIASMNYKNFGKLDFKRFHPSGNLATKLKTVEDLMISGNKVPFVAENSSTKNALKILSKKNLGVLIVRNKIKKTIGIVTDGDLKRAIEKNSDFNKLKLNKIMTKNPVSIDQNELAAKALNLMTSKKITSLCVFKNNKKDRTIGIIHIHNILNANIN